MLSSRFFSLLCTTLLAPHELIVGGVWQEHSVGLLREAVLPGPIPPDKVSDACPPLSWPTPFLPLHRTPAAPLLAGRSPYRSPWSVVERASKQRSPAR